MGSIILLSVVSLLICSTNQASLYVRPERNQFAKGEPVSLSCGNGSWTVKRSRNISGTVVREAGSPCKEWGKWEAPACTIRHFMPKLDTGVYWCESSKNITTAPIYISETSKTINEPQKPPAPVTAQDKNTILPTPPVPQLNHTGPARSLVVALVCHLVVLCPYVVSTVLLVSVYRHRNTYP